MATIEFRLPDLSSAGCFLFVASSRFDVPIEFDQAFSATYGSGSRTVRFWKAYRAGEEDHSGLGSLRLARRKKATRCDLNVIVRHGKPLTKRGIGFDDVMSFLLSQLPGDLSWSVTMSFHYDNENFESLVPLPIPLEVPVVADLKEIRGVRAVGERDGSSYHLIVDRWDNKDFHHSATFDQNAPFSPSVFLDLFGIGNQLSKHALRERGRSG